MSQIDKSLFKDEPGGEGGSPFASGAPVAKPVGADFKDPRPLTAWVNGFIWVDSGFSAVLGLMLLVQFLGLADVVPLGDEAELTPGQLAFTLTVMIYIAFVIVRMVLALRWFWRANKNARALSHGLETTPGWAWGFFFIPFMNLFRPFKTMEEIWASSQSPHGWKGVDTPVLMRWWWGLWLVGNGVDNLGGRLLDGVDTMQAGAIVGVLGYGLAIACNVTFQRLINPIAQNQWAHSQDSVFD